MPKVSSMICLNVDNVYGAEKIFQGKYKLFKKKNHVIHEICCVLGYISNKNL